MVDGPLPQVGQFYSSQVDRFRIDWFVCVWNVDVTHWHDWRHAQPPSHLSRGTSLPLQAGRRRTGGIHGKDKSSECETTEVAGPQKKTVRIPSGGRMRRVMAVEVTQLVDLSALPQINYLLQFPFLGIDVESAGHF